MHCIVTERWAGRGDQPTLGRSQCGHAAGATLVTSTQPTVSTDQKIFDISRKYLDPQTILSSMTRHGRAAYLETSFWSEDAEAAEARDSLSDEDEGIGSDESVSGPGDKTAAAAASKRELSVTRFLRVLKQSVRRGPGPGQPRVSPGGRRPAAASAPPSAASAAVFGVELAQHLAATGSSVPGVVREESHGPGHVSRVTCITIESKPSIQPRDLKIMTCS